MGASPQKTRRRPPRRDREQAGVGAQVGKLPSSEDAGENEKLPYISASMRSSFKNCRYQWSFRYMRKLEPKVAATPLRFGTLIHKALELYYCPGVKRGPRPAETFEREYALELETARSMGFRDENDVWHDAANLGVEMLEHYVDTYGKDDEWEVLATEAPFTQPILDPVSGKVIGYYVGVLDNVLRHRGNQQIWIRDHKSAKSIDTSYLAMDDQSSGYWTYGVDWLYEQGVLKPGQQLMGIDFNFLRKAVRDERPKNELGQYLNKDGSVSKVQPSEFFKRQPSFRGEHERQLTRARCAAEIAEIQMVKAGQLALLKRPDKMSCKWCDVRDICELHETGADWEEMMRLIMKPRTEFVRQAVQWEHDH
jgi:hypothetical protein